KSRAADLNLKLIDKFDRNRTTRARNIIHISNSNLTTLAVEMSECGIKGEIALDADVDDDDQSGIGIATFGEWPWSVSWIHTFFLSFFLFLHLFTWIFLFFFSTILPFFLLKKHFFEV